MEALALFILGFMGGVFGGILGAKLFESPPVKVPKAFTKKDSAEVYLRSDEEIAREEWEKDH